MKDSDIHEIIKILKEFLKDYKTPIVTLYSEQKRTPYQILITTLLSLRTKDEVTAEASRRLFKLADDPYKMVKLTEEKIAETIYPVGFYRNKAKRILEISRILIDKYGGEVPDSLEELLKLPGVGRKTANLVVTLGYEKPGICVDTHVHRITNRWGYVKTKTPEETEMALRKKLPEKYWIDINNLLVTFGQNICKPVSPLCSQCPIEKFCPKIGVIKHR